MKNVLEYFLQDEAGAVTVDWVVLTAAIVGLGTAVIVTVSKSATNASNSVGASLEAATPSDGTQFR